MSSSFVDLTGGMGYEFTDQIKVFAGYRYLKVDYKNDGNGFIFDIEMQGPMLSGTYKF
jgi:opacity protein-like surface antigen